IADERFVTVRAEFVAERRGAAVLPDDGVADGPAGLAVPDDGRLPLVGDTDGGAILGRDAGPAERFDGDADLGGPDFERVVLDPAGLGEDLGEFFLRDGPDAAVMIEDDGPGAGGAFVEGEDAGHGGASGKGGLKTNR